MNLFRRLLGRRQFLIASAGSAITILLGRASKTFDFLFKEGSADAAEKNGGPNKRMLKAIVVYYSATGSTARVANAIYRGMNKVMQCDVAPVKKIKPEDMAKYDVVALGAPIWLHREPANIKVFTNAMPRMDGKYCILFTTHGTQPFSIFWTMSRNLLKKGMTVIGWNDWYGDATHVLHATQPYITHGHPDETDLKEAEAFGIEMAERVQKIAAGEKALIPEIPTPQWDEASLWSAHSMNGHVMFGGLPPSRPGSPDPDEFPEIDVARCVYPRCTQCMDNCPVNAIDIPMATPAGWASSPLVNKNACAHCGGLCARMCSYDAITYIGERTRHAIDTTRCIYPKCTLCSDECLMNAIDLTKTPPVVHENCEGCDVCWCICPVDGASVITNLEKSQYLHIPTKYVPPDIVKKYNLQDPPGMEGGGIEPGNAKSGGGPSGPVPAMGKEGEAAGPGPGGPGGMMPKFRQLIPDEEIGKDGYVIFSPKIPRIVLNKNDWPYARQSQ